MSDRENMAQLATEFWKLHRAFERAAREIPEERLGKISAQLRYSNSQLQAIMDRAGFRLVTFDNQEYSAELPASPMNAEDINEEASCFVEATIEPAIVADGVIIRPGKVLLRGS